MARAARSGTASVSPQSAIQTASPAAPVVAATSTGLLWA